MDSNDSKTYQADETQGLLLKNLTTAKADEPSLFSGNWFVHKIFRSDVVNDEADTVFLLLNTMIGSGILNQPEVFMESGIIMTLIMYIIAGFSVWLGTILLVHAGEAIGIFSYTDVAMSCSPYAALALDLFIVITNIGSIMSYIITIGSLERDSLIQLTGISHSFFFGRSFLIATSVCLFVFPLCLIRQFGNLVKLSKISITAIGLVVLLIVFGSSPQANDQGISVDVKLFDLTGACSSFGSIVFAFAYASATFHAYNVLNPRTTSTWTTVSSITVLIGSIMCFIVGLFGYLAFGNETNGEILENFTWDWTWIFKLLVAIHLIFYITVDFLILRHSVSQLLYKENDTNLSLPHHVLLTICLLTVPTILVLLCVYYELTSGQAFSYLVNLTGAVGCVGFSFILPGYIYCTICKDNGDDLMMFGSRSLLVFGCVCMIIVPISIAYRIQEETS